MGESLAEYAKKALMARAAYASFGLNKENFLKELMVKGDGDFPIKLAEDFSNKYQVYAYYPNDEEGLSFTIFKEVEKEKYTIAIRGTSPTDIGDMDADINYIAKGKIPIRQVYKLYNALTQMINKKGEIIKQIVKKIVPKNEYRASDCHYGVKKDAKNCTFYETKTVENNLMWAEKLLDNAKNPISDIDITGHSLGGNLAVIAGNILGNDIVGKVCTYNGAGVTGLKEFFDFINKENGVVKSYSLLFPNKVVNMHSDKGLEIVSGQMNTLFYPDSQVYKIFIDMTKNPIEQHSIVPLANSLRIMALIEKMDNSNRDIKQKIEVYNRLFERAKKGKYRQSNSFVNEVCKVFMKTEIKNTNDMDNVFIDTPDFNDRELYRRMVALERLVPEKNCLINDDGVYSFV